ncbi:MAG: hypothetical protein ACYTFW_23700, partial [Planctomycetota bacterium]
GIYLPDRNTSAPNGTGDREATFQLISGVTIKGGYAGLGQTDPNVRDLEAYETILCGDLAGNDVDVNDPCDLQNEPTRDENSFHVVTGSGTDETSVLDGFTITAGNAFETPWRPMVLNPNNWGGGMYNKSGSPTLADCTFTGNSAEVYGGGMYNNDPNSNSKPTLSYCAFVGNSAKSKEAWKGGWEGYGGGIYNLASSPDMERPPSSVNVSIFFTFFL